MLRWISGRLGNQQKKSVREGSVREGSDSSAASAVLGIRPLGPATHSVVKPPVFITFTAAGVVRN